MEKVKPTHHDIPPSYDVWPSVPKTQLDAQTNGNRSNAMDLDNVLGPHDRHSRATSTLSMDDIEAAQALEGLRADFMHSPTGSTTTLMSKIDPTLRGSEPSQQPEPLLSLITSQHPILSTAINGSLSAYSSSKSYSPRFRYGAEFVERNIASPVASTVGTAGRISGVENSVRWWLQRRDSSSMQDGSNKRRRIESDGQVMDVEKGLSDNSAESRRLRAASEMSLTETLPAYDDQRSPKYEEQSPSLQSQRPPHDPSSPSSRNWQTRLMMSTSGLGVAMSEESLRSLKYCLSWLRWANNHLCRVLDSLQNVLQEWDRSQRHSQSDDTSMTSEGDTEQRATEPSSRDEATMTQHIQALKAECLQTLKNAVDVVSKYAGGALPENARVLVRRHLTSLPYRFRVAQTTSSNGNNPGSEKQKSIPEVVSGAQRVVVLAKEGLDMMAQVSGVVSGTIVSAEEWCDRLGRRRTREEHNENNTQGTLDEKAPIRREEGDVQMTEERETAG